MSMALWEKVRRSFRQCAKREILPGNQKPHANKKLRSAIMKRS